MLDSKRVDLGHVFRQKGQTNPQGRKRRKTRKIGLGQRVLMEEWRRL